MLLENDVKFTYLDITESMLNLKRFLKYRDSYEEFKEIKEGGRVGLPCIVVKDSENGDKEKLIFDVQSELDYLKAE